MADGNHSAQADRYETIKVEASGRVGLVHLHRPKNLNALNAQLSHELLDALRSFDQDEAIGAMIVTGSERAFAAGADIEEMARKTLVQLRAENYFGVFDEIARLSKPIIAAVSGYALGGGCELALLCDIIIAAESAQFGQPEMALVQIARSDRLR
jgi:enoyl-CoA hydratase/carnithine racemase